MKIFLSVFLGILAALAVVLLAMFLYGYIDGWLLVKDKESISSYQVNAIYDKLESMSNPIIKKGYDLGVHSNRKLVGDFLIGTTNRFIESVETYNRIKNQYSGY